MAYLLQILVVVISLRIKLDASKQLRRLALYTMISPEQKIVLRMFLKLREYKLTFRINAKQELYWSQLKMILSLK